MDRSASLINTIPDWLCLPEELVASIAIRLTLISDYIRFGAVCTQWNSIARQNRHRLPGHLPWLLLAPGSSRTGATSTTSTSRGERRVCGAGTGGWLVEVDDSTTVVSLFNPFTGFEIALPPLATRSTATKDCYLWKAVLSILSPPASAFDSGFVVMALYGHPRSHKRRLALLYRRPDNNDFSWVSLGQSPDHVSHHHNDNISDLICYRGRYFYAVDNDGRLFECDINDHSPPRLRLAATHLPDHEFHEAAQERRDYIRIHGHGNKRRYLVESIQGDLLQAVVLCNVRGTSDLHEAVPAPEVGIEVFKHEIKKGGDRKREEIKGWWVNVCAADDDNDEAAVGVGEQILLLGLYASFAFSASEHFADRPAPCKGTWIYNGGFCYPDINCGIFTYTMISRKLAFLMFFKQNVASRMEFLLSTAAEPRGLQGSWPQDRQLTTANSGQCQYGDDEYQYP